MDALDSANEADVSQGSMYLLDISATDDEDTRKRKVCEFARKSDTDFTAWKDKLISEGVMGLQERDNTVNDYADSGKRRPKNPDSFGTPISYMKERGVFQPLPSTTNPLGLCRFLPRRPSEHIYAYTSETTGYGGTSQWSPSPHEKTVLAVYHRCVPRWPRYSIGGYSRSCICRAHLLIFQSSSLTRPRMGTSHACPVAHSVRMPSRMIQRT